MLFIGPEPLYSRMILFIISLLFFGFSISYKITKEFSNQKLYSVFGIVFYRTELKSEFPDYISIFSGSFSVNNDWSSVSALGTKERHDKVVVRFFTENRNTTLYITNRYDKALNTASDLSKLLDVEIHDATKE